MILPDFVVGLILTWCGFVNLFAPFLCIYLILMCLFIICHDRTLQHFLTYLTSSFPALLTKQWTILWPCVLEMCFWPWNGTIICCLLFPREANLCRKTKICHKLRLPVTLWMEITKLEEVGTVRKACLALLKSSIWWWQTAACWQKNTTMTKKDMSFWSIMQRNTCQGRHHGRKNKNCSICHCQFPKDVSKKMTSLLWTVPRLFDDRRTTVLQKSTKRTPQNAGVVWDAMWKWNFITATMLTYVWVVQNWRLAVYCFMKYKMYNTSKMPCQILPPCLGGCPPETCRLIHDKSLCLNAQGAQKRTTANT